MDNEGHESHGVSPVQGFRRVPLRLYPPKVPLNARLGMALFVTTLRILKRVPKTQGYNLKGPRYP